MVQHNQIAQVLDEVNLMLAKLKERPATPTSSEKIKDLCEQRTNILAKLGWLPFTPVTVASQEVRSVQPLSNSVQETLLSGQRHEGMRGDTQNHENGQSSEFVASAIPSHVSARSHSKFKGLEIHMI